MTRVPLRGFAYHPNWGSPGGDYVRETKLIAAAGSNLARWDAGWQNVQPKDPKTLKQGESPWSADYLAQLDRVFKACTDNGLKVILSFLTWPSWSPPPWQNPIGYACSATMLAQRYSKQLAGFEVFNEPNDGTCTPSQYATILRTTHAQMKSWAPTVPVLGGSLMRCDIAYLKAMLAAGAPMDGLAIHPYSSRWPVSTAGSALDVPGLKLAHDTVRKPLWVTEFGTSTVSPQVDSTYSVTEAKQAELTDKAWADVDTLDFVAACTQYNCVRNGADGPAGDTIWGRWGVVTRNWVPLPAYNAAKVGIGG